MMGDAFKVIGTAIGLTVVLVWAAIAIGRYADQHSCAAIEKRTGIQTEYYGLFEGCYVNINGRWIPRDTWRGEQQ